MRDIRINPIQNLNGLSDWLTMYKCISLYETPLNQGLYLSRSVELKYLLGISIAICDVIFDHFITGSIIFTWLRIGFGDFCNSIKNLIDGKLIWKTFEKFCDDVKIIGTLAILILIVAVYSFFFLSFIHSLLFLFHDSFVSLTNHLTTEYMTEILNEMEKNFFPDLNIVHSNDQFLIRSWKCLFVLLWISIFCLFVLSIGYRLQKTKKNHFLSSEISRF